MAEDMQVDTVIPNPWQRAGAHSPGTAVVAAMLALLAWVLLSLAIAPKAGAAGWIAPRDISVAPGPDAQPPRVAVDPEGNAVAVWMRPNAGNATVQAATRAVDGNWTSPVDLSTTARDGSEPEVAMDAAGNAYAIWAHSDGANVRIEATTRAAGGAWQTPVDISAAGRNALGPRLAVDAAGNAIAVWFRFDGTANIVQAALRPAGGSWQAATNLSAAGRDARIPDVAVNPQGVAVAIWQRSNGTNLIIQAASHNPGGAWSAPVDLSAAGQDAGAPQVAIDPNGGAVAVWDRQLIVQSSVRPPGSAWQAPTNVSAGCGVPPVPRVAVAPQGTAAVVWTCFVGSSTAVQASLRPAGGGWDPAFNLTPGGSALTPQVTFDQQGKAIAIWTIAGRWVIQSASRPAGGGWQPAVDVTSNGQVSSEPQIGVDSRGNAVGVWRRSDNGHFIAQAGLFDAVGPLLNAISIPIAGWTGQALSFSVSPLDLWSAVGATQWTFGDGTSATGNAVSHAYAATGTYDVGVTSVDAMGNANATTSKVTIGTGSGGSGSGGTGTTTNGTNGSPPVTETITQLVLSKPVLQPAPAGPTVITRLTKTGTRVRITMTGAATVIFKVERAMTGRRVGTKCVKKTSRNRSRKSCKGFAAVPGQFSRKVPKGSSAFTFSGRIAGHRLGAGRYRLVATPVAGTRRGKPARASFRVVR